MTTVESGGFRFVSHIRRGLIALPGVASSGTVSASATMSDGSQSTDVTLSLANLGDVTGIDASLVSRRYPLPGATDVESEFFPLLEFSAPEFPWLMPTPDGAHGPMPWLCLVVVEARDGVSVTGSGGDKPDVLHIDSPARPSEELPDPADAALWVHAFAATAVQSVDNADPTETTPTNELGASRFIAARRLRPNTSYIAALVPVYSATALSGLGHPIAEITAAAAANPPAYAWTTSTSSVQLPAYVHWEFSCGVGGDFESMAKALHEVQVPPDFGTRPLDLGLAGAGMPVTASLQTVFRGALTAPGIAAATAWPDPSDADQGSVDTSLVAEIAAAAALTEQAAMTHPHGRPAIGPLLYARAAAGRDNVTPPLPAQDWFDQLNRDPRARTVAGLGSRVLRRNVEDVMAKAWEQVGAVEEANAVLRRLQMSRAVAASLHERHLSGLAAQRLISVARPVLGRVTVTADATGGTPTADALAAVAVSALPAGTTWRGLVSALRPGSRLGDRAAAAAPSAGSATARFIGSLTVGIAEPDVTPDGTLGLAEPSGVFGNRAAMFATDGFLAAVSSANLPVPDAKGDPAALVASLDSVTASANVLSATAAGHLAEQTGAILVARQLPSTVVFAHQNGVMMSPAALSAKALSDNITVHGAGDQGLSATITPALSATALSAIPLGTTHFAAPALIEAARSQLQNVPVAIQPIPRIPIGAVPVAPVPPVVITLPPPTVIPVTPGLIPIKGPVVIQLPGTDPRLAVMQNAYASAVDRLIRPGVATNIAAAAALNFDSTRNELLANLQPTKTIALLAAARVPAISALVRPDPVAPVMVGPVFSDAAYHALASESHDAFVPGLDSIPPDSVTLLQTNPMFIAAYLAGLNSALGHELLWRGYPTDERGTYWHSFWGAGPEIGPLHLFKNTLADNLLEGKQPLLVLVLRGRLLKRYPDADIYAVQASDQTDSPELDDGSKITRPVFRDAVSPDITLVGFPLTEDEVVGATATTGYWFVIAEHPGQPRFGLTDADPKAPHPPLPTWDELSWGDLGPGAAAATYVPATGPSMAPLGTTHTWANSAADMAAITYQPAVRVAIRARDLIRGTTP